MRVKRAGRPALSKRRIIDTLEWEHAMGKTLTVTLQLSDELNRSVADLSTTSGQSLEVITQDALQHYIDWRTEQQRDLQDAISAADHGEFASLDEVNALFARHDA
jgi:predicted transcriptional regulator